jgi:glycosyltransferase involved in cell wall biosynthesis
VVLTGTTGGIGRHVAGLVPRLQARGHRIRIWAPADVAAGPLDGLDAPVEPLYRLARLRGADLVHAHGYKASALAAPFAAATRAPLVSTWHNDIPPAGPSRAVGAVLRQVSARSSAHVLGVSSDLVDAAHRLGARATLMPVPAPPRRAPAHDRLVVRGALGVPEGVPLVLCVARLAPQKDLDLLLDAAARTGCGPAAPVYLVAGDGPERDRLQRRIDEEGLPVRLLGVREDVPDLLGAADLAVNTSRWEGSSLAVQEVMQSGLPLVLTDVGGNRGLVGEAAVLVPPGDADAVAAQVARLAADPAARAELSRAATERAAGWPDADQLADRLDELYRRLVRT